MQTALSREDELSRMPAHSIHRRTQILLHLPIKVIVCDRVCVCVVEAGEGGQRKWVLLTVNDVNICVILCACVCVPEGNG